MNKKGIRIIAGICFILYAALFFTGSFSLINIVQISAALVVGIGLLVNRSAVSAVGGLLFVVYHIISPFLQYRYHGYGFRLLLWFIDYPLLISAILLVILCFAKSAAKGLGIISAVLVLYSRGMLAIRLRNQGIVMGSLYIYAIVLVVGLILIGFAFHQKKTKKTKVPGETSGNNTTTYDTEIDGYCSLGKHVLLLLFTCGIWLYIWIYRTTRLLNCVEGEEERNPTTKLLLCMFVPFYFIYWTYKSAQRIDKMAKSAGIDSDLSTLCLILAIFVGIIPPILMQEKINSIVTANRCPKEEAQPAKAEPQPEKAPEPASTMNTVEELKAYKELLDMGVLTQEEFDAKKKQLLGL